MDGAEKHVIPMDTMKAQSVDWYVASVPTYEPPF